MRAFVQPQFILFFFLLCLPSFSQETRVVQIGVALLSNSPKDVSATEVRDQLVQALNQRKIDSKQRISLYGVALESSPGSHAIAEARKKRCEFVLYSRVESIEKASRTSPDIAGKSQGAEVDTALVEYELRRVTDGAPYAIGMSKSYESDSVEDAILNAIGYVPNKIATGFKDSGTRELDALTIAGNADKSTPALNRDDFQGANFCAWLPKNIPHSDALRGVCEYAVTQHEQMPNFVCQQETSRYQGNRRVPTDLITATIRYVDGEESYRDIQRNGKPIPAAMWRTAGLWSSGQFEGNLHNIFDAGNRAAFVFAGENTLESRSVWVFTYHIARQYEPLWELRAEDQLAAPPYDGELWIDQKSGTVLHFRASAKELPAKFPIRSAEILTDYGKVAFPDGSGILLPVRSSIATRYLQDPLTRNVVEFHGCRLFRATSHVLLDLPPGTPVAEGSIAAPTLDLKTEIEESEKIYAILREEAVADDAVRLNREQQQELRGTAGEVFWKLAKLEKQREKVLAANANTVRPVSKYEMVVGSNGAANFKVDVKLVPVSVVVRDNKGHAVGSLKQEDFQVFDNRKSQEIVTFSLERAAITQGQKDGSSEAGVRAPTSTNNVAYVFDDLHTASDDLSRAKMAAEKHLERLAPQDMAAVFTTSGEIALDFTADHDKLRAALQRMKSHFNAGPADCPQISYYIADAIVNQADSNALQMATEDALECTFPDAAGSPSTQQSASTSSRVHTQPNFDPSAQRKEMARREVLAKAVEVVSVGKMETDRTLGLLHDVLGRAAGLPGRRTILLVSPGFLTATPEEQRGAMFLIERALRADVVFSSLDVRGLAGVNLAANRSHINEATESRVLGGQEDSASSGILADLAYGTGGIYFHHNTDLDEGFRQASNIPEYIYVLGFSPQRLDGKFHKLKITVSGSDKRTIQSRPGYYAFNAPPPAKKP